MGGTGVKNSNVNMGGHYLQNPLIDKSIVTQSGEVNKDKINLAAGAITLPFAEMVWVTTGGDRDTINRLTEIFVSMNTLADCGELFSVIQMLYGLIGLQFSDEAAYIPTHKAALEYFIFSFVLDFGEIIKDYIAEERSVFMAVFRIEKTQNYTIMSNQHLRNENLSLKAKRAIAAGFKPPAELGLHTCQTVAH